MMRFLQADSTTSCAGTLGLDRPLALPEPEPTRPFSLSLPEPTYRHRPDLYGNNLGFFNEKKGGICWVNLITIHNG